MNTVKRAILGLLVLLAVSSGVSKLVQMDQEVAFFSQYGFSNAMLIGFGLIQLLGGIGMIFNRFRVPGAVLVLATFAISAVLLFIDNNFGVTVITLIAMGLLLWVMRRNPGESKPGRPR